MNSESNSIGYSADVRLRLIVGERTFELASIGPERVKLREPAQLASCDAEVVMNVDDFERRWQVYLPDGISPNSREVRTVTQPAAAQPVR
jgi:hypothetical protein